LEKHKIVRAIDGVERMGSINTKILVSAPSNAASDILANKINRTGVKVIRMYSKKRELIPLD
jgi:regulator of nonsense transcripts 1